jgi:hypothetical protein
MPSGASFPTPGRITATTIVLSAISCLSLPGSQVLSSRSFSIFPWKLLRTWVTDMRPPVAFTTKLVDFFTLLLHPLGIFDVSRGDPSGFGKNSRSLPFS